MAWHVVVWVAVVALLLGWQPTARTWGLMLKNKKNNPADREAGR